MRILHPVFLFLALWLAMPAGAQDLHLTNYRYTPLFFNPANTGAFLGSYRIGAIYRDQYSSFIDNGYKSQMLTLDSPIALGFGEHHWVGWGFTLFGDKAGDIAIKNSDILGSVAYHIAFDKDYKDVITIGAQYGSMGRKVNDPSAAVFGDAFATGSSESEEQNILDSFEESFQDLNIGVMYRKLVSEAVSFETGASVHHLLESRKRPDNFVARNFFGPRINVHGIYRQFISSTLLIEPAVFVSLQDNANDISLQFSVEYLLKGLNGAVLNVGLGHRFGDAIEIMLGGRYKDWRFGLSYDLTVSSASTFTNYSGGFEIGAQYILKIYKRPEPDPSVFCPRF